MNLHPGKCDTSMAGWPAEISCPKCLAPLVLFTDGCVRCTQHVALYYAAHLISEHPEFLQQIKAGLS